MVPFAGWSLPVQFAGTLAEHAHARSAAALFDVSHMGQVALGGAARATALERLVPVDVTGLALGRQRYGFFLNEAGGTIDDIVVANHGDRLVVVMNASRTETDLAHLRIGLPDVEIEALEDRALLALQGPLAVTVLCRLAPEVRALAFQALAHVQIGGVACWVSRSGYTGEDGFEISLPAEDAERVATLILAEPEVLPAGLAARDTLRLEAGLCLYGQDLDMLTTPVEAGLAWAIGKRRRAALDFVGGAVIGDQLANGPTRRRVGILPEGRSPVRAGADLVAEDDTEAGTITSGTFSPTLGAPVAMGYVRRDLAASGAPLGLSLRGRRVAARVAPLPFVPHRFVR